MHILVLPIMDFVSYYAHFGLVYVLCVLPAIRTFPCLTFFSYVYKSQM
jgi:hypothetical protein